MIDHHAFFSMTQHTLVLVSVCHSEAGMQHRVHDGPGHQPGDRGVDSIAVCHYQHILSIYFVCNVLWARQGCSIMHGCRQDMWKVESICKFQHVQSWCAA